MPALSEEERRRIQHVLHVIEHGDASYRGDADVVVAYQLEMLNTLWGYVDGDTSICSALAKQFHATRPLLGVIECQGQGADENVCLALRILNRLIAVTQSRKAFGLLLRAERLRTFLPLLSSPDHHQAILACTTLCLLLHSEESDTARDLCNTVLLPKVLRAELARFTNCDLSDRFLCGRLLHLAKVVVAFSGASKHSQDELTPGCLPLLFGIVVNCTQQMEAAGPHLCDVLAVVLDAVVGITRCNMTATALILDADAASVLEAVVACALSPESTLQYAAVTVVATMTAAHPEARDRIQHVAPDAHVLWAPEFDAVHHFIQALPGRLSTIKREHFKVEVVGATLQDLQASLQYAESQSALLRYAFLHTYNALRVVILALQNVDEEVTVHACGLAALLMDENPDGIQTFMTTDGLGCIAEILYDYNDDVLRSCFVVLRVMCFSPSAVHMMVERGIVSRIASNLSQLASRLAPERGEWEGPAFASACSACEACIDLVSCLAADPSTSPSQFIAPLLQIFFATTASVRNLCATPSLFCVTCTALSAIAKSSQEHQHLVASPATMEKFTAALCTVVPSAAAPPPPLAHFCGALLDCSAGALMLGSALVSAHPSAQSAVLNDEVIKTAAIALQCPKVEVRCFAAAFVASVVHANAEAQATVLQAESLVVQLVNGVRDAAAAMAAMEAAATGAAQTGNDTPATPSPQALMAALHYAGKCFSALNSLFLNRVEQAKAFSATASDILSFACDLVHLAEVPVSVQQEALKYMQALTYTTVLVPKQPVCLVASILNCEEYNDEPHRMLANGSFQLLRTTPTDSVGTLLGIGNDALASLRGGGGAPWAWDPIPPVFDADDVHDTLVTVVPLLNGLLHHSAKVREAAAKQGAHVFILEVLRRPELELALKLYAIFALLNMWGGQAHDASQAVQWALTEGRFVEVASHILHEALAMVAGGDAGPAIPPEELDGTFPGEVVSAVFAAMERGVLLVTSLNARAVVAACPAFISALAYVVVGLPPAQQLFLTLMQNDDARKVILECSGTLEALQALCSEHHPLDVRLQAQKYVEEHHQAIGSAHHQ